MLNQKDLNKKNQIWTIPTILWGLFLLYATLKPPSGGESLFPRWMMQFHPDKIEHFMAWFIWFMILSKTYLNKLNSVEIRWSKTIQFAVISIVWGGCIEILQWQLQWGRSAEWLDWLADIFGLFLGITIEKKRGFIL